jgi:hypothetical protein
MTYTGGPLNELNGKMGISAPQNSVSIMKLIRAHQPKSKQELVDLIKYHFKRTCKCGVKSRGTVFDFGKNLYHAQLKYWGEYRYSQQQCIQWEYDLFIVQSLKGNTLEKKAAAILLHRLPDLCVSEVEEFLDEELRIDLAVKNSRAILCGIQVKPVSFLAMRSEVILFNKNANEKWGRPVFYFFYDKDGRFTNERQVLVGIKQLVGISKPIDPFP